MADTAAGAAHGEMLPVMARTHKLDCLVFPIGDRNRIVEAPW